MATQTIERNKELKEASMTAQVAPSQSKTRPVYQEPLSSMVAAHIAEEKQITATAEIATYASALRHRDGLLVSIARPIVAFHDWLSGPPMSDRDRLRTAIAEARYELRYRSF